MISLLSHHTWETLQQKLLPVMVILAVLVLSAVGGWRSPRLPLGLAFGALGLLPLLLMVITRIDMGIVALLVVSVLIDFAIGTGTQSTINASMLFTALLLVVWLVRMVVVEKKIQLVPTTANLPLAGLLVAACVSFIAGLALWNIRVPVPGNVVFVQAGALSLFILSAGAFWLVANNIRDVRWLKVLFIAHAILGVCALTNIFLGQPYRFRGVSGLYAMWAVALAYGQLLFNRELTRWQRLLLVGVIGYWFYWEWFAASSWVSGWGPSVTAVLVITGLRSRRMLVVALVALLLLVTLNYDYFYDKVWLTAARTGSFNRYALWGMGIQVGLLQPVLGLGPGNYLHYVRALFSGMTDYIAMSHNNYIDVFSQTGIFGLACLVWFLLAVGRLAWRLRTRFHDDFAAGYVHSALGAWVAIASAMMLGDWFIPYVYNIGLYGFRHTIGSWLFLGGLVSLSQISSKTSDED